MKVTRSQLKQIIKEELDELFGKKRALSVGPRGPALGGDKFAVQAEYENVRGVGDLKTSTIALYYKPDYSTWEKAMLGHTGYRWEDERIYYDRDKDKWVDGAGKELPGFISNHQDQAEKAFQEIRKSLETQAKEQGVEIKDPTWGLEYKKGLRK